MSEVYLVPADLFKKLSNLINFLEENTQKLIDNNSNISTSTREEEIYIQNNIDMLLIVFNDAQNIKEELKKIDTHQISRNKTPYTLLYAGTQVFNEIINSVLSPVDQANKNLESIN